MKRFIALMFVLSFAMATMASAAPTVIRVTPGDSISVLAEGAKAEVRTVTRHVGGLTRADKAFIADELDLVREDVSSTVDDRFKAAETAVDTKLARVAPWTMWDAWQWVMAIAALLLISWFLAWVTGRAMRPADPYPYHQPLVTNNVTCSRCADAKASDKPDEIVLRGPAVPGIVLYGTIEHQTTVQQIDVTEVTEHTVKLGGEVSVIGLVEVDQKK